MLILCINEETGDSPKEEFLGEFFKDDDRLILSSTPLSPLIDYPPSS